MALSTDPALIGPQRGPDRRPRACPDPVRFTGWPNRRSSRWQGLVVARGCRQGLVVARGGRQGLEVARGPRVGPDRRPRAFPVPVRSTGWPNRRSSRWQGLVVARGCRQGLVVARGGRQGLEVARGPRVGPDRRPRAFPVPVRSTGWPNRRSSRWQGLRGGPRVPAGPRGGPRGAAGPRGGPRAAGGPRGHGEGHRVAQPPIDPLAGPRGGPRARGPGGTGSRCATRARGRSPSPAAGGPASGAAAARTSPGRRAAPPPRSPRG